MYKNSISFGLELANRRMINVIRKTTDMTKKIAAKTIATMRVLSDNKQVSTQKYSFLDVHPQLSGFTADYLTRAELKRTGKKGHANQYELHIEGVDCDNKLPNGKGREFEITFSFDSIYTEDAIKDALTNAKSLSFVDGMNDNWCALAFQDADDNRFLVNRTRPTKVAHKHARCDVLDLGSIFCEKSQLVRFPAGLRFTA